MRISLGKSTITNQNSIQITGSKSESNRLLLLKALYPEITISNISNSDDAQVMQKALTSESAVKDIHHAGTAMRFLTAYYAIQNHTQVELTGSSRMQERPIKILVDALNSLGAQIEYKNKTGFPPIIINGTQLTKDKVELQANVSSQYISALLLIAPKLKNGLELTLNGKITSTPYIKMTLSLLDQIGVETSFKNNIIHVQPLKCAFEKNLVVESDWSSASYFYSTVALSKKGTDIVLSSYKENSLQGDSVLQQIYKQFGVNTYFNSNSLTLKKTSETPTISFINIDLSDAPDIAQTIAVTCLGLKIPCNIKGLHTLKIKETDRLVALKTEIEKFGTPVQITENSLSISSFDTLSRNVSIDTYNDHRMAMAFAPLALKVALTINEAEVVSKSYPDFWEHLQDLGFEIK